MADELTLSTSIPELLGTYGDRGNALALVHRAEAARDRASASSRWGSMNPFPRLGDIYVLGGGEDSAQLLAAVALFADGRAASSSRRPVLRGLRRSAAAVAQAPGQPRRPHAGLGLLDVTAAASRAARSARCHRARELPGYPRSPASRTTAGTPRLGPGAPASRASGHRSRQRRRSLARAPPKASLIATYLHGPALVRNPPWPIACSPVRRVIFPAYDDQPRRGRLRNERLQRRRPSAPPTSTERMSAAGRPDGRRSRGRPPQPPARTRSSAGSVNGLDPASLRPPHRSSRRCVAVRASVHDPGCRHAIVVVQQAMPARGRQSARRPWPRCCRPWPHRRGSRGPTQTRARGVDGSRRAGGGPTGSANRRGAGTSGPSASRSGSRSARRVRATSIVKPRSARRKSPSPSGPTADPDLAPWSNISRTSPRSAMRSADHEDELLRTWTWRGAEEMGVDAGSGPSS